MNIGVIGTGNVGGTLVRKLTKVGHKIRIANSSGPDSLKNLAKETGTMPVEVKDVATGVDFVIIAIPQKAIAELPRELFKNAGASLFIVDTGNYYPIRDGQIAE